jgi:hypothetical protein
VIAFFVNFNDGKEAVVAYFNIKPLFYLEGLRKVTKYLSQIILLPSRESKRRPSDCK